VRTLSQVLGENDGLRKENDRLLSFGIVPAKFAVGLTLTIDGKCFVLGFVGLPTERQDFSHSI
jgi:hypothetical protein